MASESDKKWGRPTAKEGSSYVWKYFEVELPDKKRARCNKCPSKYFKFSGSTSVLKNHLEKEHQILNSGAKDSERPSQIQSATSKSSDTQQATNEV